MKTCLICGLTSEDAVPTCPRDGEASWQAIDAAAGEPMPATDPAPVAETEFASTGLSRSERRAAARGGR